MFKSIEKRVFVVVLICLLIGVFGYMFLAGETAVVASAKSILQEEKVQLCLNEKYEAGVRAEHGESCTIEYELRSLDEYDYVEITVSGSKDISFLEKNSNLYKYDKRNQNVRVMFCVNINHDEEKKENAPIDNIKTHEISGLIKVYQKGMVVQQKTWKHFCYATLYGDFFAPYELTEAKLLYYQYLKDKGIISSQEFIQRKDKLYLATEKTESLYIEKLENRSGTFSETEVTVSYTAMVSGSNLSISGTVIWTDFYGNSHPARKINVKIMGLWDGNAEYNLANLETNANGAFSVSGLNANYIIFFRIFAASIDGLGVQSLVGSLVGDTYCLTTTPRMFSGTEYVTQSINGTNAAKAFYIHQAIIIGRDYATAMGYSAGKPSVTFPRSATQYNTVTDTIWVLADDYCDFDVILHEYGHFIMDKLSFDNSIFRDHSSNNIMTDCLGNKRNGIELVWNEGWATYFSISAQLQQNIATLNIPFAGDTRYHDVVPGEVPGLGYNLLSVYPKGKGEGNELAVSKTLFQLTQSADISITFQNLWDICSTYKPKYLSAFMARVYEFVPKSQYSKIGEILEGQNVAAMPEDIEEGFLNYSSSTLNWIENSGMVSVTYPNSFSLIFMDENYVIRYSIQCSTNEQYSLSQEQVQAIASVLPGELYWGVQTYQYNSDVNTGPYYSHFQKLSGIVNYSWIQNGYELLGYTRAVGSIVVSNTYNGRAVVGVGDRAFANKEQLSQIAIPNTIISIGYEAFSGCTALSTIKLPSTVTQIGFLAFDPHTALDSDSEVIGANNNLVVLDGTASSYGSWQNKNFNIVEISINPLKVKSGQLCGDIGIPSQLNGQTITEINNNAFENQTQIVRVSVPSTVVKIGKNAFSGCSNLEYMVYWSLQNTTANVPDHSTSYTNYYYTERFTGVQLEAGFTYTLTFDYNNLQSSSARSDVFTNLGVGENCFALDITGGTHFSSSSSGTQTIVFTPTEAQLATSKKLWCRFIRTSTPQTVSINISNVQVYLGVTSVDIDAFNGCPKLASPGLSYRLQSNNTYAVEGVDSAGWDSFFYSISRTLFIPSVHNGLPVTTIDSWAFREDEYMRWAFFQSGLTTIGNRAFQFCYDLESVNLSATSVTRFEDYTFDTCKLGTFKFPSTLTYIGEGAFIRAGIVGTIPESVTTIGDYAFSYRTVQTMTLPTNLVTIGNYAFYQTAPYGVNSIPATVTSVGSGAFFYSKFSSDYVLSPNSALYSIGSYAFNNSGITNIVLPSTITSIGSCAFGANSGLTIYTSYGSKPAGWNDVWNNNLRPVVWGCALSSDGSYVISFTKSASNPDNFGNGIINPIRRNYNFKGWYTTPDFSDTKYSTILEAPNGVLYAKWNEQSCVAEGTLITLADGSHVAVEDLTGEEELLVWNLLTGQFDSAPILFVDSDPYRTYEITHLFFSDGTEVKVIDEHAFWDINLNKYVFIRNDAARYIGHWFSKQDEDPLGNMVRTTVQLVDVQVYEEQTTAWSPVTYGHLCFYVNDMLSMPGATEGLINIFDVDATTMTYDAVAFAADVAEYGLFTYEEFAALIPVPEVVFDAFNGQYLKVSIGKGLITLAQIAFLIDRYSVFFA